MRFKTVSYTVSLPTFDWRQVIVRLKKFSNHLISFLLSSAFKLRKFANYSQETQARPSRLRFLSRFSKLPFRKIARYLLILAVVALVVFAGSKIAKVLTRPDDRRESVAGAKAVEDINREFSFPLINGTGEEVSKIKYAIQKAELRDEIVVKGQRATAIQGREFLIITLKVKNEYDQAIEINTRDYLRLSVNNDEAEWLAPDIHNDPVEVQAISTKFTRVGFPINDTDRDLVLRVGEIDGDKEKIALSIN